MENWIEIKPKVSEHAEFFEIANDFTVDGQKDFPLKQPIGRTHTWMGLILETTNDLAAAPSWNTAMTPEGMHVAIV